MGSAAAAARGEGGFADVVFRPGDGASGGGGRDQQPLQWGPAGGGTGSVLDMAGVHSPRLGFATAQRIALGAVAAAARAAAAGGRGYGHASPRGGVGGAAVADAPALESALRHLALGEPNAAIAAAAQEAADAIAALVTARR